MHRPVTVMRAVQRGLTLDLLLPRWRKRCVVWRRPYCGHCYVATEALYHLLGGERSTWVPMAMRWEGATHWFLFDPTRIQILDPTAAQFRHPPKYGRAVHRAFLTRRDAPSPSARARELMARVRADLRRPR